MIYETIQKYTRIVLRSRQYRVMVRMEWKESPEWLRTSIPEIWAGSRSDAAAKAIRVAQKGSETGWNRIIIESVVEIKS